MIFTKHVEVSLKSIFFSVKSSVHFLILHDLFVCLAVTSVALKKSNMSNNRPIIFAPLEWTMPFVQCVRRAQNKWRLKWLKSDGASRCEDTTITWRVCLYDDASTHWSDSRLDPWKPYLSKNIFSSLCVKLSCKLSGVFHRRGRSVCFPLKCYKTLPYRLSVCCTDFFFCCCSHHFRSPCLSH